jgi:hypothetical protein
MDTGKPEQRTIFKLPVILKISNFILGIGVLP